MREGVNIYIYIYERKGETETERGEFRRRNWGLRKSHKSRKSVVGTQLGSISSPVFGVATQLASMAPLVFLSLFSPKF